MAASEDARAKIQHLLVTGDNRLKQGVSLDKVRESYEAALEAARPQVSRRQSARSSRSGSLTWRLDEGYEHIWMRPAHGGSAQTHS